MMMEETVSDWYICKFCRKNFHGRHTLFIHKRDAHSDKLKVAVKKQQPQSSSQNLIPVAANLPIQKKSNIPISDSSDEDDAYDLKRQKLCAQFISPDEDGGGKNLDLDDSENESNMRVIYLSKDRPSSGAVSSSTRNIPAVKVLPQAKSIRANLISPMLSKDTSGFTLPVPVPVLDNDENQNSTENHCSNNNHKDRTFSVGTSSLSTQVANVVATAKDKAISSPTSAAASTSTSTKQLSNDQIFENSVQTIMTTPVSPSLQLAIDVAASTDCVIVDEIIVAPPLPLPNRVPSAPGNASSPVTLSTLSPGQRQRQGQLQQCLPVAALDSNSNPSPVPTQGQGQGYSDGQAQQRPASNSSGNSIPNNRWERLDRVEESLQSRLKYLADCQDKIKRHSEKLKKAHEYIQEYRDLHARTPNSFSGAVGSNLEVVPQNSVPSTFLRNSASSPLNYTRNPQVNSSPDQHFQREQQPMQSSSVPLQNYKANNNPQIQQQQAATAVRQQRIPIPVPTQLQASDDQIRFLRQLQKSQEDLLSQPIDIQNSNLQSMESSYEHQLGMQNKNLPQQQQQVESDRNSILRMYMDSDGIRPLPDTINTSSSTNSPSVPTPLTLSGGASIGRIIEGRGGEHGDQNAIIQLDPALEQHLLSLLSGRNQLTVSTPVQAQGQDLGQGQGISVSTTSTMSTPTLPPTPIQLPMPVSSRQIHPHPPPPYATVSHRTLSSDSQQCSLSIDRVESLAHNPSPSTSTSASPLPSGQFELNRFTNSVIEQVLGIGPASNANANSTAIATITANGSPHQGQSLNQNQSQGSAILINNPRVAQLLEQQPHPQAHQSRLSSPVLVPKFNQVGSSVNPRPSISSASSQPHIHIQAQRLPAYPTSTSTANSNYGPPQYSAATINLKNNTSQSQSRTSPLNSNRNPSSNSNPSPDANSLSQPVAVQWPRKVYGNSSSSSKNKNYNNNRHLISNPRNSRPAAPVPIRNVQTQPRPRSVSMNPRALGLATLTAIPVSDSATAVRKSAGQIRGQVQPSVQVSNNAQMQGSISSNNGLQISHISTSDNNVLQRQGQLDSQSQFLHPLRNQSQSQGQRQSPPTRPPGPGTGTGTSSGSSQTHGQVQTQLRNMCLRKGAASSTPVTSELAATVTTASLSLPRPSTSTLSSAVLKSVKPGPKSRKLAAAIATAASKLVSASSSGSVSSAVTVKVPAPIPTSALTSTNNESTVVQKQNLVPGEMTPAVGVNSSSDSGSDTTTLVRFVCHICDAVLLTAIAFEHHLKSHQVNVQVAYGCSICKQRFPTQYARDQHLVSHTQGQGSAVEPASAAASLASPDRNRDSPRNMQQNQNHTQTVQPKTQQQVTEVDDDDDIVIIAEVPGKATSNGVVKKIPSSNENRSTSNQDTGIKSPQLSVNNQVTVEPNPEPAPDPGAEEPSLCYICAEAYNSLKALNKHIFEAHVENNNRDSTKGDGSGKVGDNVDGRNVSADGGVGDANGSKVRQNSNSMSSHVNGVIKVESVDYENDLESGRNTDHDRDLDPYKLIVRMTSTTEGPGGRNRLRCRVCDVGFPTERAAELHLAIAHKYYGSNSVHSSRRKTNNNNK